MAWPAHLVEAVGHAQTRKQQNPDLQLDLAQGNRSRGDRPVGLVDRVDLAVVVVVDGLGEARQQGAAHQHAGEGREHVVHTPLVVTAGCGTTDHPPDQGDPGDRFHQLQPQLPDVGGA